MRTRLFVILLWITLGSLPVFSQQETSTEDLLTLRINTRVLGQSNQVSWQETVDRHTLIGKSVVLFIEGVNFKLKITFTPYRAKEGAYLLVAQSEIRGQEGNRSAMATTLQTLELRLTESAVFFPMGTKDPEKDDHQLMLQITLLPFVSEKKGP